MRFGAIDWRILCVFDIIGAAIVRGLSNIGRCVVVSFGGKPAQILNKLNTIASHSSFAYNRRQTGETKIMTKSTTIRLISAAAATLMLAAACSSTPAEDAAPRTTDAPAATPPDTTTQAAEQAAETTSAPAEGSTEPDGTGRTEAPTTTEAAEAPVVVITHGPIGVTNGRDQYGEGGNLSVTWNVTPAEASCAFSLNDTDGNTVIHEILTYDGAGEIARDLEVLYSVQAGKLPITLTISCHNDNGAGTVIGETVRIVEPQDETTKADGEQSEPTEQTETEQAEQSEQTETEQTEPETTEPESDGESATVVKNYERRSANSVLPATDVYYFDHDEIRALFPECAPFDTSPEVRAWLDEFFGLWDAVYADWDTETQAVGGANLASGWWTTAQIRMMLPDSQITAETARTNAYYDSSLNYVYLWNQTEPLGSFATPAPYPFDFGGGQYTFPNLYQRLALAGYSSTEASPGSQQSRLRLIRDNGIAAPGPNPPSVHVGQLLAEWALYRYWQPPTTREPTAWAMATLMEARAGSCVAASMRAICESGEQPASRHLRHSSQGGSRLGTALWSIVCPEIDPEGN